MKKKNFGDFIKQLDFFGAPVTFSIDGNHKFTTKLGGVCSLILALACLLYAILSGYILFLKLDTKFNQNTITNYYDERHIINAVKNVTDDLGNVMLEKGFNIAFGLFNDDLTILPNIEQYFKLRVRNFSFSSV